MSALPDGVFKELFINKLKKCLLSILPGNLDGIEDACDSSVIKSITPQ